MRSKRNSVRWVGAGFAMALVAPLTLAGRPGGGTAPPPNPEIVCLKTSSGGRELVVMNADGSNARTLLATATTDLGSADWSPDGTRLAFMYRGADGPGVYTIRVDGTGLTKVVSVDATTDSTFWSSPVPRWSPVAAADGKSKIAYVTTHSGGTSKALWIVSTDGADARQLTTTPAYDHPLDGVKSISWKPDATAVAVGLYEFTSNSAPATEDVLIHELGVVSGSLAITSTTNLTDESGAPGGPLNSLQVASPSWSRRAHPTLGWRLAVSVNPGTYSGQPIAVWTIPLGAPASPTKVSPSGISEQYAPCWSPADDRFVVGQWSNARCIYTMNADGTALTQIAKGSKSFGFFTPTWRRNP